MGISESVTEWLRLWRDGDDQAIEHVADLVYQDLGSMAAHYLAGESNTNTLQPTALVHEAYLRVHSVREFDWKERGQVIAVIAKMMLTEFAAQIIANGCWLVVSAVGIEPTT